MSVRNLDPKQHWRCKTIAFRVSPEEDKFIDIKVKSAGMLKQDYLVCKALDKDVVVYPNMGIKNYMKGCIIDLTKELRKIRLITEDSYILDEIKYIIDLVDKMYPEQAKESDLVPERDIELEKKEQDIDEIKYLLNKLNSNDIIKNMGGINGSHNEP